MPVVGMIHWRDHVILRTRFDIGQYLYAIAGGSSNAIGKTALEVQQYTARLKQEENR
jgi:hypothetical protein